MACSRNPPVIFARMEIQDVLSRCTDRIANALLFKIHVERIQQKADVAMIHPFKQIHTLLHGIDQIGLETV